jgi:hypothetical protein
MEICEADLTSLLERIEQAPMLREYHVWEAARCLSIDLRDHRSSSSTRRFAELIGAGAMLDAVMLPMIGAERRRFVSGMRNVEGRWLCTLRIAPIPTQKAVRTFRAGHQDLPAALLMSLLLSFRKGGRGSTARAAAPEQQCSKRLEHHDT